MDKTTFIRHYCANYKTLENEVVKSSAFVSIEPTNYATFSANFIFLLLSICSEIDSVAGEYCKIISPASDNVGGIINKIELIISKQPNLRNTRIVTKEPFEKQYFVPFVKLEQPAKGKTDSLQLAYHDVVQLKKQTKIRTTLSLVL